MSDPKWINAVAKIRDTNYFQMLTGPQKCISSIVVERFNASLVTHL